MLIAPAGLLQRSSPRRQACMQCKQAPSQTNCALIPTCSASGSCQTCNPPPHTQRHTTAATNNCTMHHPHLQRHRVLLREGATRSKHAIQTGTSTQAVPTCSAIGSCSGKEPRAMSVCATGMPVCSTNSFTSGAAGGQDMHWQDCELGAAGWDRQQGICSHSEAPACPAGGSYHSAGSLAALLLPRRIPLPLCSLPAPPRPAPCCCCTHPSPRSRRRCTARAAWPA